MLKVPYCTLILQIVQSSPSPDDGFSARAARIFGFLRFLLRTEDARLKVCLFIDIGSCDSYFLLGHKVGTYPSSFHLIYISFPKSHASFILSHLH